MLNDIPDWIVAPVLLIVVFAIAAMIVLIGANIAIHAPWLFLVIPGVWLVMVIRFFYKRYKGKQ